MRTTEVVPSPTYIKSVTGSSIPREIWKPYLLILLLGQVHEDLTRRVLNIQQ
jgi:hypothetical protein